MNRKVEIKKDGEWIESSMKNVKEGDVFRMFESNGDPVVGKGGFETEFIAYGDSIRYHESNEEVWTVVAGGYNLKCNKCERQLSDECEIFFNDRNGKCFECLMNDEMIDYYRRIDRELRDEGVILSRCKHCMKNIKRISVLDVICLNCFEKEENLKL
jgi:hypothetical protein